MAEFVNDDFGEDNRFFDRNEESDERFSHISGGARIRTDHIYVNSKVTDDIDSEKKNLEKEINVLQRHFKVNFTDEQRKKFSLGDKGRRSYETEDKDPVYITKKNGEIYSDSILEKNLVVKLQETC